MDDSVDAAGERFASLVEAHGQAVFRRVASRFGLDAAEDAYSTGLLSAFQHFQAFDEARGSFEAWLTRICLNVCVSDWRWRRRFDQLSAVEETIADERPGKSRSALELTILYRELLVLLPARQRLVLLLESQGHTIEEIAERLRMSATTIKTDKGKARSTIRAAIHAGGAAARQTDR